MFMKTEHNTRPSRPWSTAALILAFWTIIALLYTGQNFFSTYFQGKEIAWSRLISWSFTRWLLWALATPVVFYLARRFTIERSRLVKGLAKHLGLGIIVAFSHIVLEVTTNYLVWKIAGETIPTWDRFRGLLTYSFHVNLLVYWAILGAWHTLDYHKKFRERELHASQLEAQLTQARLQALEAQIKPHFLFNTHHAILSLMLKKKNDQAIKMLTQLSDLLRLSLENTNAQKISLKEELDFLKLYLDIQQTRFKDRLHVVMNIADNTLNARVPNLIMQPLVENAITHGIAPHSNAGRLEISSTRENGRLKLLIRDDGPGLANGETANFVEGVGLSNTKARLQQMYGGDHDFKLTDATGGGLLVTMDIPFQETTEGSSS